jgi:hypothetical protein
MTAWALQRKPKIHYQSSKLQKSHCLRAEVVCGAWWCDHLMKKGFPLVNRSFQTNFKFAVSLIALRAASSPRFRSNSACVQCQWQRFVFLSRFSSHVRLK